MRFLQIELPVSDPDVWADWFATTLGLRRIQDAANETAGVTLGWSQLRFVQDAATDAETGETDTADRAHHLAFAIPTGSIERATSWIEEVTGEPLMDDDGTTLIDRGGSWASRSIYFHGPEGSILELIEHADRPAPDSPPEIGPDLLLGVAEIGIGTPDVAEAAAAIETSDRAADLPFGFGDPAHKVIAAYGDSDGAFILAAADRPWYPTQDVLPVTSRPTVGMR
ncbi:MAG TPA: VOC family protein [Candidatus Corynebacterium avicola]|uniref:VOC family protein n=1 Tax=Candidatus Corynebacterium avicola TaxID=2838527 RepID=A0A9D1UM31_9CORY|nr:VOC family protein [Candidatus Corynebacterium avicola]